MCAARNQSLGQESTSFSEHTKKGVCVCSQKPVLELEGYPVFPKTRNTHVSTARNQPLGQEGISFSQKRKKGVVDGQKAVPGSGRYPFFPTPIFILNDYSFSDQCWGSLGAQRVRVSVQV